MSDPHGCAISKGERWCATLKKCIEEYDQCDPGEGDVKACTYAWAGLSWDPSPLKRSAHYVIQDVAMQEVSASYTIGICADVAPGDVADACDETTGSASESMAEAAPAYQVFDDGSPQCYRTGGSVDDDANVKWGLLDPQAPSAGVYVRYYGGNTCSKFSPTRRDACDYEVNGMDYCRRSTKLNFVCNNHITEVSEHLDVQEGTGCAYEVTMNSVHGCPLECPRGGPDGFVCANNGVCSYDGLEDGFTVGGDAGVPRCLCKLPYGGDDCYDYATIAEVTHYVYAGASRTNVAIWWVGLLAILAGLVLLAKSSQHRAKVLLTGLYNLVGGQDDRDFELATTKGYQADGDEAAALCLAEDAQSDDEHKSADDDAL